MKRKSAAATLDRANVLVEALGQTDKPKLSARLLSVWKPRVRPSRVACELSTESRAQLHQVEEVCARAGIDFLSAMTIADALLTLADRVAESRRAR